MTDLIKKLLRRFRRLITYGAMGIINTLLDYGVFALCYELLYLPVSVSQAVGFLCGSVCGYLLNSNVTFREGKGRTKAQMAQYLGVDVVLTAVSSGVMHLGENAGWPVYLVKIAMTAAMVLIHYTIYKYCVFRIKKEDSQNE